ncbi:SGNH hydrolase domain-containing protein [Enterovibrio norvegicus]|uniref:SGNH hydrolase domain-containing protein n=1 Tax=Enterovibrio norvegicus TaxID=188144 RepID=UPI003899CBB3
MPRLNQLFSPASLPIDYTRYADPTNICHGKVVGDCFHGDLSSDKEVLVLGDSHAAMLNKFFDYLGRELHFKARIITASSCVTIQDFDIERLPSWAQTPCLLQIEEAQQYVGSAKTIILAGMWSYQLESEKFKRVLSDFVRVTEEKNKNLLILSQVPELESNPTRALRFMHLGLPYSKSISKDNALEQHYFNDLVLMHKNLTIANFRDLPIFEQLPFSKSSIIYMDSSHLNEVGAIEYAKQAKVEISKFFRDLDENE